MTGIRFDQIKQRGPTMRESARFSISIGTETLLRENHGFTLLELMISLSLLAISMLSLLTLTTTSIQANLENDVRNGAIRLINQTAEVLLVQPIEGVVTCGLHAESKDPNFIAAYTFTSTNGCLEGGGAQYKKYPNPLHSVRGALQYPYNITWTVQTLSNDLKQAQINVTYVYRNKTVQNNSVIFKHKVL